MTIEPGSSTPQAGERLTAKGVRTREKILVTAGRHFARHGYSAVTLRDIADDVGITAAMVVRYFGNKRNLFEAVAHAENSELTGRRPMPIEERALQIIQYWQNPDVRTPMIALLRSLDLDGGGLFLSEFKHRVTSPLTDLISGEDADVRLRLASGLGLGFGLFALGTLMDPDQPPMTDEEIQRFVPYLARLMSVCLDPPASDAVAVSSDTEAPSEPAPKR